MVQKPRQPMISLEKQHFTMASFRNVYTALLLVIARSTDRELARQVSYLKSENQILRSLPERLILTQREEQVGAVCQESGSAALNQLATIAYPGTIRRWIREAASRKSAAPK